MVYLDIEKMLKKRGKTKYWLVKNMDSGYQTVSAMINNETSAIRFETIEKLCKLLECTPNDIIKIR
jgi:putative transcriptional regulator